MIANDPYGACVPKEARRRKIHHPAAVHLRRAEQERVHRHDYIVWRGWQKIGRVMREGGVDTNRRHSEWHWWGWIALKPFPMVGSEWTPILEDSTRPDGPPNIREPKLFKTRKAAVEAILG